MRSIQGCKCAVVGGAGFLGSHLVDFLIESRNCKVLVIDNLVAGRREFIHKDAHFVHHDITQSEEHLQYLFEYHFSESDHPREGPIDYVFNYAAYPYVPDSYARPLHVCNVNFFGAMKVINAAHAAGCKGILQVSSAELYGNDPAKTGALEKIPEWYPVNPHSSYGASKAAIDGYCQVRWYEAKVPVIALRQFNCLGSRETHKYVVPEIIGQLAAQTVNFVWCIDDGCVSKVTDKAQKGITPIVRLGNDSARDFMYAGDAVRMGVELLEKGNFGDVYNLGSESSIKIYDLAKLIGELMGFAEVRVEEDPARKRAWEIWHLASCNDKIYSTIESRPTVDLREALRRTIAYYEANGRKWCWE